MKLALNLAFALIMAAMPLFARADDAGDTEARRIATRFVQLAGSEDNAVALVLAIHHGLAVQLVQDVAPATLPLTITLEPPTGPMPWNDVRIALLHAQDLLLHAGYTRPDVDNVQAALTGGEILDAAGHGIVFRGILNMRAEGMTWVDIARATAPANTSPAFLAR
jgi:hypothetical protein